MADSSSDDSFIDGAKDNDTSPNTLLEISISPIARFWIILFFEIPSILCSLTVLYYLCFDRTLPQALNNHVIIILLIIGLFSVSIDIPNFLSFLRLGHVWPETSFNCYVWWFVDTANYNTIGMLMAWARSIFLGRK